MLSDIYYILQFMRKRLTKILHLTRFAKANKKGNIYFSGVFTCLPDTSCSNLKVYRFNLCSLYRMKNRSLRY